MKQFNFTFFYSGSFVLLVFLLLAACSSDDDDTTAPAEVSNLRAIANDGFVDLEWTPPTDTDLEYIYLNYSPGGSLQTLEKTATSATVSDLTNGTEYTFTLQTEDRDANRSTGTQIQARPLAAQLFADDFNTRCDVPFMEDPDYDPWIIFSIAAEGDDAEWSCATYGSSNLGDPTAEMNYAITMENAGYSFGPLSFQPVPGDDWLITPAVELPEESSYKLHFSYYFLFSDVEGYGIKLMASTDYSGSGDPSGATWTEINTNLDYTPLETQGSVRTTEVSLSDWADSSVYFAFHYTSSGNTTQTAYLFGLDDVAIRLDN
ncbi:MAG: choice-of-anchor J domain-containing protein [Flavobacteriaceae bacterium]